MSTGWTKLAYGTIAAVGLLGGTAAYKVLVQASHISRLIEAVNERSAAVASWPWTTNAAYSGWSTSYRTNIEDSALWSFMGYRHPLGDRYIPLIAGVLPGRAMSETMRQVKVLIPKFLDAMETNSIGAPVARNHTVTGLFSQLQIGDGTSKWTVAYTTNGTPIFGDEVAGSICTTTFSECWAVLDVLTQTWHTTTRLSQTNETIKVTWGAEQWALTAGDPPGDPNGEALVQDLNHYAVTTNWQTNDYAAAPRPFEEWVSVPLNYSLYERTMTNDVVISKTNVLHSGGFADTSRIQGDRSFSRYGLELPTFPSGVLASASFVTKVVGNWTVQGLGITNSLDIYGLSTACTDVAFTGALGTNMFTNLQLYVFASVTNWIPTGLLSVDNAMIFDLYTANTNPPWVYQSWRWEGMDESSSPSFSFGGRLEADAPVVLIRWNWLYKKEEPE